MQDTLFIQEIKIKTQKSCSVFFPQYENHMSKVTQELLYKNLHIKLFQYLYRNMFTP
jgi:hypothetical protein